MEIDMPGLGDQGFRMIGARGYVSTDPSKDKFQAWQAAQAELEALKAGQPMADPWMPETRKTHKGDVQYRVNDKWWDQSAWDDPSFQQSMVEPYRQTFANKAQEEYQRKLADMMQRAAVAQHEYETYLQRQEEIKGMSPSSGSGSIGSSRGTNNRMLGVGRR